MVQPAEAHWRCEALLARITDAEERRLQESEPASTVTTGGKWSTTVPVSLIWGVMVKVNFAGRGLWAAKAAVEMVARLAVRRMVIVNCIVLVGWSCKVRLR